MTSNGSWQKVKFDEICKNISDRIDDPKQAKTDYYVGLEHLDSEDPKISRHGSPQDVSKTKLLFKPGHILFGKRNWYLRRLAVAQREGICSAHMLVLEPIEGKSTKEFLPLLMFGDDFYEKALMVSAGSMSPTIKWKDLAPLEFLIPSIEQQENILSLTHKIDQTISNSQNLLEKTKNYMISRRELLLTRGIGHTKFKKVKWMFGKTIEIPEEWTIEKLSQVCKIFESDNIDSDLYIGLEHIEQGTGKLLDRGNTKDFVSTKHVFQKDNILYGKLRPLLKKIWITTENGFCSTDILSLEPNKKIIPTILASILLSTNFLSYAVSTSAGTKMPRTNWTDMKEYEICLPSIAEQEQISSILSNIDKQITQQQSHLTNLKVLRKSILNSKLTKEKTNVAN